MNSVKKLISLLLALVLCVSTLAACSNVQSSETTDGTTNAAEGTTVATTQPTDAALLTNAERYPINFDGTLTVITGKTDADKADNWVRWEEWTGVDVEWKTTTREQTPLVLLDNNQMPDMFFQTVGLTVAQINEYGQGGLLVNYMDHLDKMPNLAARYAEDPMLFDAVKDANGDVYTLPYYCDTLTMSGNQFFIRTDMTKEAGIDELPTTIEGFLEMCETLQTYYKDTKGITEYEPMVCNGEAAVKYNGAYANFFFPAFGELMRADITTNTDRTKIEIGFATEQFKHYLEFMNTLYVEGYMDSECFVADANTNKARMIEKTTSMNPSASYLTKSNFASGENEFQVYPPVSSEYQTAVRWANPNHYLQGFYMISSTCSDLDAALAFMDALYSVEEDPLNEEGTVWGISLWIGEKDIDFTVNKETGSFNYLEHEGYDSPSNWLAVAGSGSAAYLVWPYYEASGSGQEVFAVGARDILRPHGVDIFYTSLLSLNQEEQDTYNDCWTSIEAKVNEMNAAFITSQASIEAEWDNYINDLYDLGLQDVIDAYQAALDRYNAA